MKCIVLPLSNAIGTTGNVTFPWPPVVAAHNRKSLHENCITAEVIPSRKLYLYSGFNYVHQSAKSKSF